MENSENSCNAKMLQHANKICIHILRWRIFFNWTLETASGNDMDNIKCSPGYTQHSRGHNTTRQCGAELLGSVGNSVWGSALFSFAACAMQIQVDQMHYKYVENGLPNQAKQPQMHQLSNCLPRQRRHNVHQIIAGAVTRQATGHGPRLDLWLLSGLVCLTGVVCAGCGPVG